jgi:hypothetical protein
MKSATMIRATSSNAATLQASLSGLQHGLPTAAAE